MNNIPFPLENKNKNKNNSDLWYCQLCTIKNNLDAFLFIQCNNTELSNINHTNSMSFLESLPHVEIINETR